MSAMLQKEPARGMADGWPVWLLWLVPFAVVALALGFETDWGRSVAPRVVPAETPAPKPVDVALLPDYQIEGGLGPRRDTAERPLFNPTRRPAPPAAQDGAKSRMQRGQFVLTGTAVIDTKAIAFLRETNGNKARSVRSGETINGMKVAEVRPDRVRLTLGDESEELVLKVATGPKSTVQPAASPQPGAAQPAPAAAAPAAAPPAAATPPAATPPTGAQPPATTPSLLERRRAARAAAAAAAGEGAPAQTQTAPTPGAAATPGAPSAANPPAGSAWSDVYQRMQQGR